MGGGRLLFLPEQLARITVVSAPYNHHRLTMNRFKLTILDPSGKTRSATVEAASQAEAIELARRRGFQVQQIITLYDNADAPAAGAYGGEAYPLEEAETPPPASGHSRRRFFTSPLLSTTLSAVALLLALSTLIYVASRESFGSGLRKYDFSNARAAYASGLQMERDKDLRAFVEYERRFGEHSLEGKRVREKIDSYELQKEIDYGSRKGLLVTYKAGGEKRHEVVWFEKDDDSGFWVRTDVLSRDIERNDRDLAELISHFLSTGQLPPKK